MTTRTTSSRLPRDVQARERLREAQDRETRAVTTVYATLAALDTARAKRAALIAAADEKVAAAETDAARSHAALVEVSGLQRAATLLGSTPAHVRRAAAASEPQTIGAGNDRD